jgi:hypothetical protein
MRARVVSADTYKMKLNRHSRWIIQDQAAHIPLYRYIENRKPPACSLWHVLYDMCSMTWVSCFLFCLQSDVQFDTHGPWSSCSQTEESTIYIFAGLIFHRVVIVQDDEPYTVVSGRFLVYIYIAIDTYILDKAKHFSREGTDTVGDLQCSRVHEYNDNRIELKLYTLICCTCVTIMQSNVWMQAVTWFQRRANKNYYSLYIYIASFFIMHA